MNEELEKLRQMARSIRAQLTEGIFYSLLIWPPGETEDVGYFSNAHRAEAIVAMETLLGKVKDHE